MLDPDENTALLTSHSGNHSGANPPLSGNHQQDGDQGLGKAEFPFLCYSGDRNCNSEAQLYFCDCVSDPGSFHCYGDSEANQTVMKNW